MLSLLLLVTGVLSGFGPPLRGEVDSLATALSALSSEDSAERSQGERWLGTHLRSADYPLVAEAVLAGGTETERRVVRALGSDDRHLGLCVLLASDKRPELVSLGKEAIRELAGRWHTGLGLPMAVDGPDQSALRDALARLRKSAPAERYRLRLDGSLREVVERFARLAELPLFVSLDPFTKAQPYAQAGKPRALEGTWDELLLDLAVEYGVDLAAALTTTDQGEVLPLFVCFRPRETHSADSLVKLLVDWCRESSSGGERAAAAARALAGSGWPAAVKWLDERYRATEDPAALAGLLLAAERGRVAPSLHRRATVAKLLAEAEGIALLPEAERRAHALANLLPVALNGERLDELVGEGLAQRTGRSLLLRLIVLEGMTSSSETVEASLRDVLARSPAELSPGLRLQALRAWVAVGDGRELELNGIGPLFAAAGEREQASELVRLLSAAGVAPTDYWERPGSTSNYTVPARAAALEWNLAFGRQAAAADYLALLTRWKAGWPKEREFFEATAEVAEVLRRRVLLGDGERVGHFLEQLSAEQATPDDPRAGARRSLHRLVILCGAPAPESLARDLGVLGRALPDPSTPAAFSLGDEVLLGVLAARPLPVLSDPARNFLFQRLVRSLEQDASLPSNLEVAEQSLAGIERCALELLARGADPLVDNLASDVRKLMRRFPDHPLAARVARSAWPLGPSSEPVELARSDRKLSDQ